MKSLSQLTIANAQNKIGVFLREVGKWAPVDNDFIDTAKFFKLVNLEYLPEVPEEGYESVMKLPFDNCLFNVRTEKGDLLFLCQQDDDDIKIFSIQDFTQRKSSEWIGDFQSESFKFDYGLIGCAGGYLKYIDKFCIENKGKADAEFLEIVLQEVNKIITETLDFSFLKNHTERLFRDISERKLKEIFSDPTITEETKLFLKDPFSSYQRLYALLIQCAFLESVFFAPLLKSFLVFLATKPKLEPEIYPEKLQKKFYLKHKKRVGQTFFIDLKYHYGMFLQRGMGSGSEKSFHWRRGHFRKLPEKITWVRPCVVNKHKEGEVTTKEYVL